MIIIWGIFKSRACFFVLQGPYNTNLLIAGWDEKAGPSLYWMDYLATMHSMNVAGTGYGACLYSLTLKPRISHSSGSCPPYLWVHEPRAKNRHSCFQENLHSHTVGWRGTCDRSHRVGNGSDPT